jgi:acetyl-CoA carboxylase biotin carboxyl carrier protein
LDIKDIKSLIELMKLNSLSEFELENEGFKVKLKRAVGCADVDVEEEPTEAPRVPARAGRKGSSRTSNPKGEGEDAAETSMLVEVKAPMVGTFYQSPSPDSAPYVELGTQVSPDTVICIVEAMKVMNEIKAEVRGTVAEVAATNGKPVEFGQVLFRIKPS